MAGERRRGDQRRSARTALAVAIWNDPAGRRWRRGRAARRERETAFVVTPRARRSAHASAEHDQYGDEGRGDDGGADEQRGGDTAALRLFPFQRRGRGRALRLWQGR